MKSKLTFTEGVMGSAKTLQLLIKGYDATANGKNVFYIKPNTDTRDVFIKSRIGLKHECLLVNTDTPIFKQIKTKTNEKIDILLVDECQFLTEKQVEELSELTIKYSIEINCYGLKTDFLQRMFPGSKRLIELCDEYNHVTSYCSCGREATVNARFDSNGYLVTNGEQVCIGGDDRYKAICRYCYNIKKNN